MALSAKYFITDFRGNYIDWSAQITGFSLLGKEVQLTGGTGADTIYVQEGASAIATNLAGGDDTIYLTGNLADYDQTINQGTGVYTFTRKASSLPDGQTEIVKFTVSDDNDVVYFADGHITVNSSNPNLLNQDTGVFSAIQAGWLTAGGTPVSPVTTIATEASTPVRVSIVDAQGLDVPMLMQPGQAMTVTGSGADDTVYVNAGTSVNATNLAGGNDRIYLLGSLADYDQTINQGTGIYTFTRKASSLPEGQVEVVKFTVSDDDDVVYFADGHITVNSSNPNLLNQDTGVFSAIQAGWLTAGGTPLPGPTITITSDEPDGVLNIADGTATITFALSEAVGTNTFAGSDITVTEGGGALSNFVAGANNTYTATFTPNAAYEGTALISVASGMFNNADGQNNTAASLNLAVDTIAPTQTVSAVDISADTGTSATDFLTKTAVQTITGTLSGALGTGDILYGSMNNGSTWTDITNKVTTTAISWDGATLSGSSTILFKVTDAAGNDSATTGSQAYVLDTAVPTFTAQAAFAGTKTLALTTSEAVTGTPSAADFAVAVDSVANIVTNVSVSGTTVTLTLTSTIQNGTAVTVDYTQGANTLTDAAGNTLASVGDPVSVTVTSDSTVPTVSGVTSTADGTYNVGDVIPVTIQFSEAVIVTGTPLLTLETGNTDRTASYVSGSGTNTLTFNYTVQSGDASSDLDYASTSALALSGGTIKDAAGNNATLTLVSPGTAGSLAANEALVIDGVAPTITAQAANAGTKTLTLTMSEAVTGTPATGDFAVAVGGLANTVTEVVVSGTTVTLTLTSSIQNGASVTVDYTQGANTLTDAAGNALASVGDARTVTVTNDATIPTVSGVTSTAVDGTYNVGDVIPVTIQFSEAVLVTGTPLLTLETGNTDRTASYVSGSGTSTLTFSYTVQSGDASSDLDYTSTSALALSGGTIKDAAGNNATLTLASPGAAGSLSNAEAIVVEGVLPTITAQAANAGTKTLTLTMSEAVTGTPATSDFAVAVGGLANTVTEVVVSGTTVTLTLTNAITNNATVTVDYTQGTTNKITDAAGNALVSVGDALSVTVTNDNTAPTVSGVTSTALDGTYSVGVVIPVTIQFSEAVIVTGVPLLTLETGNTDRTASYVSGSGTNTLTFNYAVQSGDTSADLGYTNTAALTLNGGTIKDTAGNNATLTLVSPGAAGSLSDAKAIVIVSPSISYGTTTFVEAAANGGSIYTTATLTLSGDTFAGTVDQAIAGVTFSNVPAGLTALLIKKTATTAELSFTGNAGNHTDSNDISNFTATLGNAAFTNGNAASVTNASKSDLSINFADAGLIFSGNAGDDVLNGTIGKDIIYGNGGADVINGGAGNDTIDITDAGATLASSVTILVTSTGSGLDTVVGFKGGALDSGGDVLDFTGIENLTDSVATGLTLASDFGANNVFIFNSTPVTIAEAAAAIAADTDVVATHGYIVIADSANSNRVTAFHSQDLAGNTTDEIALVILSGIDISTLANANFMI